MRQYIDTTPTQTKDAMDTAAESSKLEQKLLAPIGAIVEKHKSDLLPLMVGKSAALSHAALKNDDVVRKVATYCYALLPSLVRFAVKESVFVSFVMSNREKLLGHLVAREEAAKADPCPQQT